MALHTDLPIYRTGVRLMALANATQHAERAGYIAQVTGQPKAGPG